MPTDLEIKCIRKRDRMNPHERIQGVGGTYPNGTRFYFTLDQAIGHIDNGIHRFWTQGGGESVWVEKVHHNGHPYLKTLPDAVQPDNLLALPECP